MRRLLSRFILVCHSDVPFPCCYHRVRWFDVMADLLYVTTPFRVDEGYTSDNDQQSESEDWTDACDTSAALLNQHIQWGYVMAE